MSESNDNLIYDDVMNNETNDDMERLISRRLDDELTEDEQLAFDRELVRNPQMRALFEAHERINAMSGDVLAGWAQEGTTVSAASQFATAAMASADRPSFLHRKHSRRWHMFWWSFPAAIAATIALVTWLRIPTASPLPNPVMSGPSAVAEMPTGQGDPHARPATRVPESGLRRVVDVPRSFDRATRNEVYYVVDKQGRLYVIEQQRVRTIPNYDPRGGMQRVVEVM